MWNSLGKKYQRWCLNKQQIKYAVAYLLCYVISLLSLRSSAKLLVFLWGLIQLLFANLFLYFFESKWMNELKKNDLMKSRTFCNLKSIKLWWFKLYQWWWGKSNYSNIYPEELQLGKENTDKHEVSFLDLNIKIKDIY